jgi:hypothetical protein
MRKRVVRLSERDVESLVKKILNENISFSSDDGYTWETPKDYTNPKDRGQRYGIGQKRENYMFFQNLKDIKENIETLLSMDETEVDQMLSNGHDWATEHIATAKDDIEEVTDFLKHRRVNESQNLQEGWKDILAGGMMALATILPKTADAQQDGRVEWETVKDTVEMVSMDMDRDTVRKITTTAYEIFKNRKGDVKKVVADIKTEYTQPNSWDIDSTQTKTEKEKTIKDPQSGEIITLNSRGELSIGDRFVRSPKEMQRTIDNMKDSKKKEEFQNKLPGYTKEYKRLMKLVK